MTLAAEHGHRWPCPLFSPATAPQGAACTCTPPQQPPQQQRRRVTAWTDGTDWG